MWSGDGCLRSYQFARALFQLHAARAFDLLAILELLERCHRRLHEVLRGRRPVSLREDVGDAREFDAGADALARRHARARAGWGEDHGARAAAAGHLVRDRGALEVDLERRLTRVLGRLLDGARNFVGLAVADADVALAVA